jgi:hypothetical protein
MTHILNWMVFPIRSTGYNEAKGSDEALLYPMPVWMSMICRNATAPYQKNNLQNHSVRTKSVATDAIRYRCRQQVGMGLKVLLAPISAT